MLNPDADPAERQIAAFVADLTMQKKNEELLRRTEKLAVAGRLAASIAHEINNPLEAVTNLLFLIGNSPLTADAQGYLAQAMRELDRVARITVQTLRFHRRSSRPTEADLRDLVESVIPLFESRARLLQATVETRFRAHSHGAHPRWRGPQVIANLVSNATDALGEGGRLAIRLAPGTHPGTGQPGVNLTVADTGSGMSKATHRPHLRAVFFRPRKAPAPASASGSRWISSRSMGGILRVRSRTRADGRSSGTVFRFFLPLTGKDA